MIKRNEMNIFLNRKVYIKTKSNYIYRGTIESISDDMLTLNDIVSGIMLLAISEVASINEYDETKHRRV